MNLQTIIVNAFIFYVIAFLSILLHELFHVFMCKIFGMKINNVHIGSKHGRIYIGRFGFSPILFGGEVVIDETELERLNLRQLFMFFYSGVFANMCMSFVFLVFINNNMFFEGLLFNIGTILYNAIPFINKNNDSSLFFKYKKTKDENRGTVGIKLNMKPVQHDSLSNDNNSVRFHYDMISIKRNKLLEKGALDISHNGVYVLSGKNGAGKTLLLNNIFSKNSDHSVFLAQENNGIIEDFSVLENITMFQENVVDKALSFLKNHKLEYLLMLDTSKMSGGEKRIISIIRALLSDAKIIFMDEPTNDLDFNMVNLFILLINEVKNEKILFLISHDDRIIKSTDFVFGINDKSLYANKIEQNDSNMRKIVSDSINDAYRKPIPNRLGKTLFKKDFFVILPILLVLVISFIDYNETFKYIENRIPYMNSDQVDISSPISMLARQGSKKGFLPLFIIRNFDADQDLSQLNKELSELIAAFQNMPVTFGLHLINTEYYDVYALEYYDTEGKNSYFTRDIYNVNDKEYIECNKLFITYSSDDPDETDFYFCDAKLRESEAVLKNQSSSELGKNYEPVYVSLLLSGDYGISNLRDNNDINLLLNGNYYIRSNETIEIVNQIESYKNARRSFSVIFSVNLSAFLLLAIYTLVSLILKKKKILLLKNYGYDSFFVLALLKKKIVDKRIYLVSIFVLLMTNFTILFSNDQWMSVGYYMASFCFAVSMLISYKTLLWMIKTEVKKVYSWKFRF